MFFCFPCLKVYGDWAVRIYCYVVLMSTMIRKILWGYVVWLLSFFVAENFLMYGVWLANFQWLFWLLRDGIRWLLVGYMIVTFFSLFRWFIGKYFWLLVVLVGLWSWSVFLSWIYWMSFFERFVGFKYDRYYLLILVSWLFVGTVFAQQSQQWRRQLLWLDSQSFLSGFVYLIVTILWVGVLWQLLKVWQPAFFVDYLWYGWLGDFVPWAAPPIYYKTWAGWVMRLSGIFAWPNVLGFFLVVVVPFLFLGIKNLRKDNVYGWRLWNILQSLIRVLWGGCLMLTFSRWAYIAWLIALLGSLWFLGSSLKKTYLKRMWLSILLIVFFWTLTRGVNYLKSWSNQERGSGNVVAREMVQHHVWWYGPGTAGHARHYWADYSDHQKHSLSLVENVYLQLGVNLGLPWLLFYCLFWLMLLLLIIKHIKNKTNPRWRHLLLACLIAIISLSIEGLVLHVWRDSQFNFLFLILVGVLVGYYTAIPSDEALWE
jgi:hypothetical protein